MFFDSNFTVLPQNYNIMRSLPITKKEKKYSRKTVANMNENEANGTNANLR